MEIKNYYELPDYNNLVSNVFVYNLKNSIIGAKYPMCVDLSLLNDNLTDGIKSLAKSGKGEGHDQWLTGITVSFDLSFTNKAWVEAERYRFLYFISSQSTMHRISKFDIDRCMNNYVDKRVYDIVKEKVDEYNKLLDTLKTYTLENSNQDKIEKLQEEIKNKYLEILYNNPSGFTLTAKMITNYRQLKTIYSQRKNHRLPEWREFCKWIETLPYSELITQN